VSEAERPPEPSAGDVSLVAALGVMWGYRWIVAWLSVAALVLMSKEKAEALGQHADSRSSEADEHARDSSE